MRKWVWQQTTLTSDTWKGIIKFACYKTIIGTTTTINKDLKDDKNHLNNATNML